MRWRIASVMPGAGASSSTFWWRRCTEQSRSKRCTHWPCVSPKTWISMWRGRCTYFSISTASSPKLLIASRWHEASAAAKSSDRSTARMPLPPPPALALMSTG
jgi:hypothetical protein